MFKPIPAQVGAGPVISQTPFKAPTNMMALKAMDTMRGANSFATSISKGADRKESARATDLRAKIAREGQAAANARAAASRKLQLELAQRKQDWETQRDLTKHNRGLEQDKWREGASMRQLEQLNAWAEGKDDDELRAMGMSDQQIAMIRGGVPGAANQARAHNRALALRQKQANALQQNPFAGMDPAALAQKEGISLQEAEFLVRSNKMASAYIKEKSAKFTKIRVGKKALENLDATAGLIQTTPDHIKNSAFGFMRSHGVTQALRGVRGMNQDVSTFVFKLNQELQNIKSANQIQFLKGQGAVTDGEREQVNKIIGKIEYSQSPKQALQLLENARNIMARRFMTRKQMGGLQSYWRQQQNRPRPRQYNQPVMPPANRQPPPANIWGGNQQQQAPVPFRTPAPQGGFKWPGGGNALTPGGVRSRLNNIR